MTSILMSPHSRSVYWSNKNVHDIIRKKINIALDDDLDLELQSALIEDEFHEQNILKS